MQAALSSALLNAASLLHSCTPKKSAASLLPPTLLKEEHLSELLHFCTSELLIKKSPSYTPKKGFSLLKKTPKEKTNEIPLFIIHN